jgi:hypothetical protein
MSDAVNVLKNTTDKKVAATETDTNWSSRDLFNRVMGGAMGGAAIGCWFDGVGVVPGALIGGASAAAEWAMAQELNELLHPHEGNAAVSNLPKVSIG